MWVVLECNIGGGTYDGDRCVFHISPGLQDLPTPPIAPVLERYGYHFWSLNLKKPETAGNEVVSFLSTYT